MPLPAMVAWRKFFRRVDGFETHRGLRRRVVELEKSGRATALLGFSFLNPVLFIHIVVDNVFLRKLTGQHAFEVKI